MLAAAVVRRLRANTAPFLRHAWPPQVLLRVPTRQASYNNYNNHNRNNNNYSRDNWGERNNRADSNNNYNRNRASWGDRNNRNTRNRVSNHSNPRSDASSSSSSSSPKNDSSSAWDALYLASERPSRPKPTSSNQRPARFRTRLPTDLSNPTTILHPGSLVAGPEKLVCYRRDGEPIPEYETPVDKPGHGSHHPMLTYVQTVSVPTADTPGAHVWVHFENRRYLFGQIAEGTQRSLMQRRLALSKLDEVFITGPTQWQNNGGLIGLILTLADVVSGQNADDRSTNKKDPKFHKMQGRGIIPSLKIYGSENINYMLATARRFVFRKGLPLRVHEIEHDKVQPGPDEAAHKTFAAREPDFKDANLGVWYISIMPEEQAASTESSQSRKRSHDDMTCESGPSPKDNGAVDVEEAKKLVKSVVNNMFDSDWELDALTATYLHNVKLPATIFVKDAEGNPVKYEGPLPGSQENVPNIPVLVRTAWPATQIQDLPPTSPSRQSMSYIVKGHERRGKFKPEVAIQHGVEKRHFKLLTAGQTVYGGNGQEVTPEMCLEPSIEGRGFAFIDLPDVSYVAPFLARPEWAEASVMDTLDIFYWNLGRGVAQDERLLAFMREHGKKTHNVFSPDVSPNSLALHSSAAQIINMHNIDPDRFSIPVFDSRPRTPVNKESKPPYDIPIAGDKWQIAPRVEKQDNDLVADLNPAYFRLDRAIQPMVNKAKRTIADPKFCAEIERTEHDIPNRDMEVMPLGTGSAMPSKYRNVSATLIRIPGVGAYLFDCGENTLGQLRRMHGFDRARQILSELKGIWISHLHADHHLGLASVIRAWYEATSPADGTNVDPATLPRLAVVSHWHMTGWVREYSRVENIGLDRVDLVNIKGPSHTNSVQEPVEFTGRRAEQTGLVRIESVRVEHCFGALACVFTWPSGLKVAYSGDCRPSKPFAALAADCTLLLHEATLDDELRSDAFAKKHCTIGEATRVARDMRARRVLFTHFSQRYPKIGKVESSERREGDDQVTLMAFDQMCVKLGDFKKAELFLPAIRQLLRDADEEEEP